MKILEFSTESQFEGIKNNNPFTTLLSGQFPCLFHPFAFFTENTIGAF